MNECKGLFLRCRVNEYVSGTKIQFKTTYSILKRRSCNGSCVKDKPRQRCITEWFFDDLFDGCLETIEMPEEPKDFAIYKVGCVHFYDDDTEYYFTKIKEESDS